MKDRAATGARSGVGALAHADSSAAERISVLIPANNEATVIHGCIEALLDQTTRRPVRIIVVANGCTDDTAGIARSLEPAALRRGFELIVLELAKGGKAGALNFGDAHMLAGVRIYLDADIRVSPDALDAIAVQLERVGCHLTAPPLKVAPAKSRITRGYARIWQELPVVRQGVVGCGLYAVSQAGRRRWSQFPDIISDDKFVRLSFEPGERQVATGGAFVVQMPEGLRELIQVRARWCRGNRDLARRFPHLARREPNRYLTAGRLILSRPSLWPFAPGFIFVFVLAEFVALRRRDVGISMWERADGARRRLAQTPGQTSHGQVSATSQRPR
jgi:hypothetical protein